MNRITRAALLVLVLAVSLAAQQLSLGTVSTPPGQTVTLSVFLATQGQPISGLQFDLIYNTANLSIKAAAAGASATAAGKSISTSSPPNVGLRVLIVGFNDSVMTDGAEAVLTIQIPTTATPGTYPIAFANGAWTNPIATNTNATVATSPGSVTVTGSVGPLAISSPNSLPATAVNSAYSQTVTASGGTAPYTWSATGLPGGLSIASGTGNISGIPATAIGSPFGIQVTVTDSHSLTAHKGYILIVNPALAVTGPASLPPGVLNAPYPATTMTATGGSGIYTWTATGLPPGLSINAGSGVITGTPTTTTGSPFNAQVTVTDSNSVKATGGYLVTVSGPLSISGPSVLPVGTLNVAYPATTVIATGGSGVYTWSATGLPAGLTINSATGAIAGTPSTATGSPFTAQVTVTDSNSSTAKMTYILSVSPAGTQVPLAIAGPATLPPVILNAAYAAAVSAQGGSGTYTWSATGLPNGLSIGASSGIVAGTLTTSAGSPYSVQVTVTDNTGSKATRNYTLTVGAPLSISGPASLPAGTVNVAYLSTTAAATGGSPPYAWSATGLPLGLSIGAATGIISGTPATSIGSPFNVQVTVTDATSSMVAIGYTLTINQSPLTLPLISGVTNAAVAQSSVAPNTWVSIYGSNFASPGFTDDWSKTIVNGNLPTVLDGVSVTAGGQPAYISYLSAAQMNVVLPNLGFGSLQVTVTTPAGTSAPVTVNSQQYSPAFFTWPDNQPVATHSDYTPAVMNGTFAGAANIPAKAGEVIILWGTGFGPTDPAAPFGMETPASPTYYTATAVAVTIDNMPASVYGTALAPSYAGLYQLVVTVPASLPDGAYTVIASINGVQSPSATLTVHN